MAYRRCPVCSKLFVREYNSQKYCSTECADYMTKKRQRKLPYSINTSCLNCGAIFNTQRNKIFCSANCRTIYYKTKKHTESLNQIYRQKDELSGKTLSEVARLAKENNMTYGKYVGQIFLKNQKIRRYK